MSKDEYGYAEKTSREMFISETCFAIMKYLKSDKNNYALWTDIVVILGEEIGQLLIPLDRKAVDMALRILSKSIIDQYETEVKNGRSH